MTQENIKKILHDKSPSTCKYGDKVTIGLALPIALWHCYFMLCYFFTGYMYNENSASAHVGQ